MDKLEIQQVLEELLVGKQIGIEDVVESITLAEEYKDNSGLYWLNLKGGGLTEYLTSYDTTVEQIEQDLYYLYFQYLDNIDNIDDAKNTFIYLLRTEDPVSGEVNKAEEYFEQLIEKYGLGKSVELINNIFSRYFNGSDQNTIIDRDISTEQKVNILTNVLHILSHLNFDDSTDATSYQKCIEIAQMSLSSISLAIQEFALKCFENWNDLDTINILEKAQISSDRIDKYRNDVIKDIGESFVQKLIEKEKLEAEYKAKLLQLYALGKMPKITTKLNNETGKLTVDIEVPKDIIETEEDAKTIRDYYSDTLNNILKEIKEQMSPENLALMEQMANDVSEKFKKRIQESAKLMNSPIWGGYGMKDATR